MEKYSRNLRLDFIRGISIISVLFYHISLIYIEYGDYLSVKLKDSSLVVNQTILKLISITIGKGYLGVQLFFLLSGYLIFSIYFNKKVDWIIFIKKRFWRIYPVYFFILTFWFLMFNKYPDINMKDYFFHLFIVHNFDNNIFFTINPSFWSLAIEVQFYILFPLICYLTSKVKIQYIFFITIIISIIIQENGYLNSLSSISTIKYLFIWIGGGMIYVNFQLISNILKDRLLLLFILLLYLFIEISFDFCLKGQHLNLMLEELFCFSLFIFLLLVSVPTSLKTIVNKISRLFTFYGLISYNLYLIHQPMLVPLRLYFSGITGNKFLNILLELVLMIMSLSLVSYSIYKLIEQRFTLLGNKK
jgi:peptidoglycan/LPS O-acetylase OafA/YrhL